MIPGDVATITYALTVAGAPTNATVTLTVTAPSGATSSPTVTNPSTGNYSADVPVNETGYWTYLWTATGAATDAESGTFTVGDTRPAWTPKADRVADLISQRVLGPGGRPSTGGFTTTTVPSLDQVERLCALTAREVERACGPLPMTLTDDAADVASLGAAARVTGSFFGPDGDYDELWAQYRAALDSLVAACVAIRDNELIPGEGASDLPPFPLGSFPPPMTIRDERW